MLAVAQALDALTNLPPIRFASRQRTGIHLTELFEPYEVVCFGNDLREPALLTHLLDRYPDAVLVLDKKYYYAEDDLRTLRRRGQRLVRVDHPGATAGTADLVVLPNLHHSAEEMERLAALHDGHLLAGPAAVILPEAVRTAPHVPPRHRRQHDLVFLAGGSDPQRALSVFYTLTAPLAARCPDLTRVFALGAYATWPAMTGMQPGTRLVPWELSLLWSSPLVVTLFGQTVYELLAVGTPALVLTMTDEDERAMPFLVSASGGAVGHLGRLATAQSETVCAALAERWQSLDHLRLMRRASQGLIDGHGARRIAERVLALADEGDSYARSDVPGECRGALGPMDRGARAHPDSP
jgi:spore coat polysaccharide biosynthesis predicted glycosyltransferase SpsG